MEITYETIYTRDLISVASGMAYIPLGDGLNLVTYHLHMGPYAANNEAPSELSMVDIQTFYMQRWLQQA